jgi:hypothetical protein
MRPPIAPAANHERLIGRPCLIDSLCLVCLGWSRRTGNVLPISFLKIKQPILKVMQSALGFPIPIPNRSSPLIVGTASSPGDVVGMIPPVHRSGKLSLLLLYAAQA